MMNIIFNQIRKDFLWDFAYKISFFLQFAGIFMTFITFMFISRTFEGSNSEFLIRYDGNYLAFSIIGIAALDMIATITRSLNIQIREAQSFGYLDVLLNSKISHLKILLACLAYPTIKSFFKICIYFLLINFFTTSENGITFFDLFYIALLLMFLVLPFYALAILAASFVLKFKQADPIQYAVSIMISIFSGIVYPTSVLPKWMETISNIIPVTHILDAIRLIFIGSDFSLSENIKIFVLSSLFFTFLFIISIIVLDMTIKSVKADGTSGTY